MELADEKGVDNVKEARDAVLRVRATQQSESVTLNDAAPLKWEVEVRALPMCLPKSVALEMSCGEGSAKTRSEHFTP